ncbi:MAG: leucine-rich repeat domain-containing protein [Cytophagaceae bacterium]|nr:leucine-rich repeat domain-containing protein [Cytophagaceae bacterium]
MRNKLLADYPSVMSGNLLNISAAGSLTGSLDLSNSNISNADGIQYFTGINLLNLNFNQLITLPDISGLTQLTKLFLSYNRLISLPSLSSLGSLTDFQAAYNQVTVLPSLAGNTNLLKIYCQNNRLTSLPDISMLTNLQILDIGNNNFTQLPDLSPLINLQQLHVHQTGVDTLIGLSSLSNLTILFAWGNHIRNLSGLNANTVLTVFQVFNNDLESLPVLSNKPSLSSVSFINNHLTFEDILPLTSLPGFGFFSYNPQKQVPLLSQTVREKDNLAFDPGIDQALTTNQYTWYKNGNIMTTNQTGIYSIPSVLYADSGNYYAEITNPGLPGLTLQTDTAILSVKACLEITSFETNILSEDCKAGTEIQLSSLNLGGGIAPFNYGIVRADKTDTLFAAMPQFESLAPGTYKIIIKDSRMCKAAANVFVRKPDGCNAIFSPNGDGLMDTYFIEEEGKIKIYDTGRNLIKELNAPAVWDGTKSDGSLADDGYYAIVINDKKIIHVTLIK